MYDNRWSTPSTGRVVAIALAVVAVVALLLQTRTSPAQISSWNGGAASRSVAGAPAVPQSDAQGLSGIAAPQSGRGDADPDTPTGDPLGKANTVMTQGYGVGSHAPANIWGAVDLAIDGDGDGRADGAGTDGTPIYATHRGTIKITPNSVPAGNHVWVIGEHFKTGYSHLKGFGPGLQDGQVVERGTVIGFVGSTGESSGPHLDYQVWKDGVNVNPLDFGALDGTKH